MTATTLLAMQSLLVSLQIINAGIGSMGMHVPGWVTLVVAALVGGGQFFVQHAGNNYVPPPPVNKT